MAHRNVPFSECAHNNREAMVEYGKLTVAKLKAELSGRGAVITGRKVNLIERFLMF